MKTTPLTVLVLLLLTTPVIAQVKTDTSDPPVSVLEKSYSQQTRYGEWDPKKENPKPRTSNEDLMKQARAGRGVNTNGNDSPANDTQPLIVHRYISYVYKVKVKNDGLKTIKALYWEYQFLDPDTQEVKGTYRIMSSKKLSPGKTGLFKAETVQPPSPLIPDDQFDKRSGLKFTEQLIIHRVDYTDGSIWRRP